MCLIRSLTDKSLLFYFLFFSSFTHASNAETAKSVADLFLSIKIVLAEAQPLINNAEIIDKGLTAEVVIARAKDNYFNITGKSFTYSEDKDLAKHQRNLFKATRTVMDEAQVLINMPDIGFKGFITAVFAKSLAREFSTLSPNINFKFTAPLRILRSAENMADEWEESVFEKYLSRANWPKNQAYEKNVAGQYRWMLPLYHESGCMSCHGSPKGQRDITGFRMEGAQVGDFAGAFSITIDTKVN